MTRHYRDQEVSKSETWIDKTEKAPKKKTKEVTPTPAPIAKEEPKKKKKKIVVKEVSPPKPEKKVVQEQQPKKKEVKKELDFSTTTGKNDMDFEEVKGRTQAPKGERKQRKRNDSLDDHSSGSDSDDDYYVPPQLAKKGDAAK